MQIIDYDTHSRDSLDHWHRFVITGSIHSLTVLTDSNTDDPRSCIDSWAVPQVAINLIRRK